MIMILHASNAVMVYFIIQKFLQSHGRQRYSPHVRLCCSFVPTVVLFGMHSLRSALFNEISYISFVFLTAVLISFLGVLTTLSSGTDRRFRPTATTKGLLMFGFVLIVLALVTATTRVTGGSGTALQLLPLPPIVAAAPQRHQSATQQHTLVRPVLNFFFGLVDMILSGKWAKQIMVGILKVLQAALNVLKAQVFLPVNVDRGYVQTQVNAMQSVLGIRCLSGSSYCGIMSFAPISFLRRMFTEAAMPVVELGAVVALIAFLAIRHVRGARTQHASTSARQSKWRIEPLGASAAIAVTLVSCASVSLSPSEGSNSAISETLLLAVTAYIPSAFLSLCLAVHLADAWADESPVEADAATSRVAAAMPTLVQSLWSMLRPPRSKGRCSGAGVSAGKRTYWFLRARQLLVVAALTIAADTTFKSFHPEPRCFFRSGLLLLEFVCCPV